MKERAVRNLLHFVHLENMPILEQLQLEEALLRADKRNWCVINYGAPPAIVLGISGKIPELINQNRLIACPIPLIRRFSGGGTVVIDQQTFFVTFIFNSDHLPIPAFPEPIMRWTEQFYAPLFHPHPFRLQENDYVMEHKKFGGNAQSITKQRWLHHSSFLYDFSEGLMDYLSIPTKAPLYRKNRNHTEFLCSLNTYWPTIEELEKDFRQQLRKQFEVREVSLEEINEVFERPYRRATQLELI